MAIGEDYLLRGAPKATGLIARRQNSKRVTAGPQHSPSQNVLSVHTCRKYVIPKFQVPDVLKVQPIRSRHLNEIIGKFGGADQLCNTGDELR